MDNLAHLNKHEYSIMRVVAAKENGKLLFKLVGATLISNRAPGIELQVSTFQLLPEILRSKRKGTHFLLAGTPCIYGMRAKLKS